MRAALVLAPLLLLVGIIPAAVETASANANGAPPWLKVPQRITLVLTHRGYPVRHHCGSVLEPPPRVGDTDGRLVRLNGVPACWLVISRDGYSVSIVPHSTPAAATLAHERTYNQWAHATRRIVLGRLLVSGFRVPAHDWNAIRQIVCAIVSHP